MDMPMDDEFDDFPINYDELVRQEEIYLSSQQDPSSSSNSQQQSQWDPPVDQVSNNRSTASKKALTVEEMEFRLKRLELAPTTNCEELYEELKDAKQMLEEKDRAILLLKQEVHSYRERGSHEVSQKRSYPGSVSQTTVKKKVSTKPSIFTKIEDSFSSQISTQSLAPVPAHSQAPFNLQAPTQSQTPSVQSTKQKPDEQRSFSLSTITVVSGIPQTKEKARQKRPIKSETEENIKLLRVLFTPLFQKWNYEKYNGRKDINTCLTPEMIQYFSVEFSKQIIPERSQCSSAEHFDHLVILASDISSYLVKSENVESSIQFLLNVFKFSLSICIKEKLIIPIRNIVTSVSTLASIFPIATTFLTKDLMFAVESILTHLTTCLTLFPLHPYTPNVLVSEVPHIQTRPMSTIISLSKTYSITATGILNAVKQEKPTQEGFDIVMSILELFYHINTQDEVPKFEFLMENTAFLNLLNVNLPYDLIMQVLSLLETNFMGDAHMQSYKDTSFKVVTRLADVIVSSQGSLTFEEWFELRFKALNIFYGVTYITISKDMMVEIHKIVFQSVNKLLKRIAIEFNEYRPYASVADRKRYDSLMKVSIEVMYSSIYNCPVDIFLCLKDIKPQSVIGYVVFFREKGINEKHFAEQALSDLGNYLVVYHQKNNIKF
ncbi:hypothetical protein BD770DRAFT_390500 [Pilaira anomala]|nr:hypothetical protein BD770DRAFT_390500 [Pilaira anomala]